MVSQSRDVRWVILPVPRGRPSTASTARGERQRIRGMSCSWAKLSDMKFPAAPESIMAGICTAPDGVSSVTGTVMQWSLLRAHKVTLTLVTGLLLGREGQAFLKWPGYPQYRQRWWVMRRFLSSGERWWVSTCMGSWVSGDALSAVRVVDRRALRRLSIWIESSM